MDSSFYLDKLFDENKIEYALKFQFSFKNTNENDSIIVNNCMYYKKIEKKKGDSVSQLFVCKRSKANTTPCSSSLSLLNGEIIKINGKVVDTMKGPLLDYHKHSSCEISTTLVSKLKSIDRMKIRAKNENVSIALIHEQEILSLKSSGLSVQHIARVVPSYKTIKSILYRCKL